MHGGYSLAFDSQQNIALISTTGAGGGGFSGDAGISLQLGILQDTSVLSIEPMSSMPSLSFAAGDGTQVQGGIGLDGSTNAGIGLGAGFSASANLDVSQVTILACGPG